MRHSPTAYKYEQINSKGFHENYKRHRVVEHSTRVHSLNAFGLRIVSRVTFNQDPKVPREVKDSIGAGAWVLYLPRQEKSLLFVGDDAPQLTRLALAHLQALGV